MAKKRTISSKKSNQVEVSPLVAAALTGIVYQARLYNRQARMNVPETTVISEVVSLWRTVTEALHEGGN